MPDAIVTHHHDGYRSGVGRFNELLADRLGVPLLGLGELGRPMSCPLLSFKVRELPREGVDAVAAAISAGHWEWDVFLHDWAGLPLEEQIVSGARVVHCGNDEIRAQVEHLNPSHDTLWSPGLILDERLYRPSEIEIFSFGMAHKVQTEHFRRLRELLDASCRSYAVYVSAANHEMASLRDSSIVFEEMHEIFPGSLYFLGNLSDVAVYNHLRQATFFAAFFEHGVRANNGSVSAAMERGAVTITNLDEHSPREYVHMDNLLDIAQLDTLPSDSLALKQISVRAMETQGERSWSKLIDRLR
ncbi:MAG TPA: hypothetical protein VGU02_00340 [Gaiellaceae bacterium]|nr:hypothetical protein [Gaiellaceae bacterium]